MVEDWRVVQLRELFGRLVGQFVGVAIIIAVCWFFDSWYKNGGFGGRHDEYYKQ